MFMSTKLPSSLPGTKADTCASGTVEARSAIARRPRRSGSCDWCERYRRVVPQDRGQDSDALRVQAVVVVQELHVLTPRLGEAGP
jgi:hypothetical protein